MDDSYRKDAPVRRFAKGDKVLAPSISRRLPLAEVLEIYEAADGRQVLLVSYAEYPSAISACFYPAEEIDYVGDRHFIVYGTQIYRVSNGEIVAESKNWGERHSGFPGDIYAAVSGLHRG